MSHSILHQGYSGGLSHPTKKKPRRRMEVRRDEEFVRDRWLKLMFYFEHEASEGEISQATYEDMSECLMTLKTTCLMRRCSKRNGRKT